MKISCPSCSAKYSIADEKVQNRLAKIRCRKCGTSIVIDGNVSPAAVYAGEPEADGARQHGAPHAGAQYAGGGAGVTPVAASGTVYTVDFGENDQRQMTLTDVMAAYNAGQVTGETYLWADGFADWTPLAQIDEIVAALNAAATGVDETSAAAASAAPSESPWADHAGQRAHMNPAAAPVAAARGADLFGGIDRAGAEVEIATSASSGSSAVGSPNVGFGASAPSNTGARNESSVLFSLSALTAAAGTSRPNNLAPVVPTQHVTEDSGLIDLKALTAAAEHRPAAAAPVAAAPLGFGGGLPMGASPLGSPYGGSPYGGLASPSLPPQRPKSNTALYIGIFAIVAVLGSVLIFRLTEKEAAPPPPPVPSTPIAAPAPLPPPMPTSAALPTAEAKAPSTGDAEGDAAPTKTSGTATKKKSSGSSTSSSTSGSTTSSSSSSSSSGSTTTTTKKKSGGGCGCAANDLMCNMRCSAK